MKSLTYLRVVGARPQFMQVKPLRTEMMKRGHREVLLHTGQHYDDAMSKKFFEDLELPSPEIYLGVGSASHGEQTAKMITGIEKELLSFPYDALIVDGDTNSTLAGALAAAKHHVPIIHIEAGMRSFDKRMPEEINRVLTDHMSTLLFCPSITAYQNLNNEGIREKVYVVGDVLTECFYNYRERALQLVESLLKRIGLHQNGYVLLTMHRMGTLNDRQLLYNYLTMIGTSPQPVIWPIHPHTLKMLRNYELLHMVQEPPFILIEPLGYLDMLALESAAEYVLTDSGGVQREAYLWKKPCTILRETTEWTEIIEKGYAKLANGHELEEIWHREISFDHYEYLYGRDDVSAKIVDEIERIFVHMEGSK